MPRSGAVAALVENLSQFAVRAKAAWARLIRKVYEVDPLTCPRCKGTMRIIALIEEPEVIQRILTHLGLWRPEALPGLERAPPRGGESSAGVSAPFIYHPVPDVA